MKNLNIKQYWIPIALLLSLSLLSSVTRASCDFLDETPRPDWVSNPVSIPDHYNGIGTAGADVDDFSLAIAQAKQKAIQDLAASIKVRVKSQLTISEAMNNSGQTNRDLEQISSLAVDSSLENVETDGIWLDRDNCQLWARVKISKSQVKIQQDKAYGSQLLDELKEHINATLDANNTFEERLEQSKLANQLMKQLPAEHLDRRNKTLTLAKLENANQKLEKQRQNYELALPLQEAFEAAVLSFEASVEPSSRNEALRKLKQLNGKMNTYAAIDSQLGLAEPNLFQLANIDIAQSNQCGALTKLNKIAEKSENASFKSKAEQLSSNLKCSKAELKVAAVRSAMEGQTLRIWCQVNLESQADYWAKACDKMREVAVKLGATVASTKTFPAHTATDFSGLINGKEGLDIVFQANGKIESRSNAKNPNGTDYRFSGKVAQAVLSANDTILLDRFSGLTGWNPVSGELAMDLLALNVVKRFQLKLADALN